MAVDDEHPSRNPVGTPITRGAFLGAASAMAMTAAVCDPRGQPLPTNTLVAGQGIRNLESLDFPKRAWAIPAGVLNALWSDVFPRLVAKAWLHQGDYAWVWPGMTEEHLIESLWRLSAELEGSSSQTPWRTLRAQGIQSPLGFRNVGQGLDLKRRVQTIAEYFEKDRSVRFQVSGSSGYDFLLSEWGVEFFFPSKPRTAADLLRYFAFRNTGRPAIGLPRYMQSGMPSVAIDAPTGPSQVFASPDLIRERMRVETEANAEGLGRAATLERLRGALPAPGRSARISMSDEVPLAAYMCLKHDWQMEGTVYRGIMVELPRVVATAWMEKEDQTHNGEHAYAKRIWAESASVDGTGGFRTLFEERLETSISSGMEFKFHAAGDSGVPVDIWDGEDVMITERGLSFPRPFETPPSFDDLLLSIANGEAGNPVFTDSKRPDREG